MACVALRPALRALGALGRVGPRCLSQQRPRREGDEFGLPGTIENRQKPVKKTGRKRYSFGFDSEPVLFGDAFPSRDLNGKGEGFPLTVAEGGYPHFGGYR